MYKVFREGAVVYQTVVIGDMSRIYYYTCTLPTGNALWFCQNVLFFRRQLYIYIRINGSGLFAW